MERIFFFFFRFGQMAFLLLFTGLAVYFLWMKLVVLAALFMLAMVVLVEKLVHTTYTLTSDGKLLLCYGRFWRRRELSLADVRSVRRASARWLGRFEYMHCVLVHLETARCEILFPVNEEEFVRAVEKRLSA